MKALKLKNLNNVKKIHFIGIGGSGMFPLAQISCSCGIKVTGSDTYESDTLQKVKKLGIKVFSSHSSENITDQDAIIYSAAIKNDNPEIQEANKKNIPIIKRSEFMGMIFDNYRDSIGVSGTHGKTTTTSMITTILLEAQKDPTAIVGGTLLNLNSNCCVGESEIIVGEACEYADSFLQLKPKISVITNVDEDHLDYFGSFENLKKSFTNYAKQTQELLVVNGDDIHTKQCVDNIDIEKVYFGLSSDNDFCAQNISFNQKQHASFSVYNKHKDKIADISLSVPGQHNVYNALAAFCVCYRLGVDIEYISKALAEFKGTHRRFEIIAEKNGITVADDFAHHPTEITTTLNAASKMGYKKVWAIFQPHTYSRTYMLLDDFAKALSIADKVIVSEILPVRETNIYNIHSTDLTKKIPQSIYLSSFEEITEFIINNAEQGDLVLTLGGGNVYECANMIAKKL